MSKKVKEYDDIVAKTVKKTVHENTVAKTPKEIVDNIL